MIRLFNITKATSFSAVTCSALVLSTAILSAGCTTGTRFSGRIRTNSTAEIEVVRAVAHYKPAGVVVDGDVRRPNLYAGVVPGYLQVEGLDASGKVVVTAQTQWGQFMSRRFRLAYFHVLLLASDPSSITTITVKPVTGNGQ